MAEADAGSVQRCGAAHEEDRTPCEGPLMAATIVTRDGEEITGCVRHSARRLASLPQARLHPLCCLSPWAVAIYCQAATLPPFAWEAGL
ncbi:hypothetical protein ACFWZ2_02080 [Streptomyces sp. NPDC059002]|uniref:hypothetical protein n=1 Tax=Streptomyces sp. NPDC059002 TaxID=3346690 RepID=UPI003689233F